MLGGRKTPDRAGLKLPARDAIYARLKQLEPGCLFKPEEVCTQDEAADFAAMRNYDYVHVVDGYCTAILEGRYVRSLPEVETVVANYARLQGISITETGDRIAWRLGLKPWEPIDGYRYYSEDHDTLLSLGHMKIRILGAPAWLCENSPSASLFRAIYDLHPKERSAAFLRLAGHTQITREAFRAAAEFGLSISQSDTPEDRLPAIDVAQEMLEFLDRRNDAQ